MLVAKVGTAFTARHQRKSIVRLSAIILFLVVTGIVFVTKIEFERSSEIGFLLVDGEFFEAHSLSMIEKFELWISSNSRLISITWLIGLAISFLRYSLGFYQIQRIKRISLPCEDQKILNLIRQIRQQLKIRSMVEVRVSSFIRSPLTSGWLKPVIYLPVGMSTGFSYEEIDTILMHEMVHIKRHDYLVNLLLASLEALFFFNPFVLVLIKDLRSDMEFACDDRVVKDYKKTTYIHALLKLQEQQLSPAMGLAAKGNNSEFIKRINKMMNRTNNSNEKSKLIPGLIICLFLAASIMGSAFISKTEPDKGVNEVRTPLNQQDTVKVNSKEELREAIQDVSKENFASTVFILNGKVVPIISGENLDKGEKMMNHIKKELVRDGILSAENKRVKLMFQYSDLLNGKEVLGDKYPKYKKIFNSYFPTYDSYATTRVFKYDKE